MNVYAHTGANPINGIDPQGLGNNGQVSEGGGGNGEEERVAEILAGIRKVEEFNRRNVIVDKKPGKERQGGESQRAAADGDEAPEKEEAKPEEGPREEKRIYRHQEPTGTYEEWWNSLSLDEQLQYLYEKGEAYRQAVDEQERKRLEAEFYMLGKIAGYDIRVRKGDPGQVTELIVWVDVEKALVGTKEERTAERFKIPFVIVAGALGARRGPVDPTRPARDVLSGSLKRYFPSQHLGKSLNDIRRALRGAKGLEKRTLQTAKKLLEQQGRLLGK
jgi:hypothetical protein